MKKIGNVLYNLGFSKSEDRAGQRDVECPGSPGVRQSRRVGGRISIRVSPS